MSNRNTPRSPAEAMVEARLFSLQDRAYQSFHCKLIPTVDPDTVIGVRTPALRKLAKELSKQPEGAAFLQCLPHKYYEENSLHGFLIGEMKDYHQALAALEDFLPHIDNWAVCDSLKPSVFKKHLPELLPQIQRWMNAEHPYTARFGVETLMRFYLDQHFQPEYLAWAAAVRREEYYVNMMIAWYFATALAKQYSAALPYLEQRRLAPWTHNKAIQKALESDRITPEQKEALRKLKWKKGSR